MVDKNNKQKLYEALSADYDMGSFEQFSTDVEDEAKRQKLYDAIKDEYELPDFNQFTEQLIGTKQQRETAAAKGDAEGASTFSEAEIKAETAAAEPQPANDLPIPQAQGKTTSNTPTPGAWPYAGAHRMQDGYVVSNAPGRDTGWRLTNEDGTPRTWAENVEATKTDEQRTREQFGEHRSGMVQDLLTDHAKTKAVPSERVVVDSEGNEVERYEVTPELSQEEAEYQARDDYYKKVKLDGERWAELEAARKQVYDEYNKELGKAHKEISELYQYVDAGAPVDIYDWVSNRRDVKALKGALKYYDEALTMVKEARAVNDSPNNFLGELAGLGRGLLDAGLDVSTWDMGMSDLDQGASTLSAILKLEAGKELTSAEQRLLAAAAANTYAKSSLGEQMGMGYKAGQTTMMSVPFMIEMALNPASGLGSAGSKALSKHLIKKYGREMIQKQLKKRLARQTMAAKWGAKIGGDAASAGVMTLTSGAAMTAADAVDRMTGTIKPTEDEEGNIVYGGRDDDYEKSVWTAARKSVASGAIERHTEMVGGYIPAMKTAGVTFLAKKMKAATNPRLRKIYREAEELLSGKAFGKWGEMVGKVADVTKLNDLAGEFFEEKIGEVENALLVGDMTFDTNSQTGIFNLDRNIETLVGLLPMQAFFGGMTALGYRTQKYRTNQALNKANKAAWETFGEDWIEMKDMIDGCDTDKDLTKVVRGIISGGTTDLRSQAAVMQYVSAVQRQKGLQLVAETAPEIVAQAEAEDAAAAAMPQPTENTGAADAAAMPPTDNGGAASQTAYDRGVAAAEADDYAAMSDIGYEADLADARIERMFEEAQRAEIAEAENTEGGLETWLESNRESLSAEQAFAVQALIDANDAYDGLTETVRHRTASEEEAIRQEMQPLATADGRIVPLTLDNGQTVYLKSGDPTNRRSTVIAAYRDETGAVRNTQVSGMSITSIGTEQSLSDYTLEAMSNINYERQQRIKDAMDGKNVAAGQTVRLYAGDELQEYEVTAVAPEGATLRSKQDGSEMTMTTEELQDELAMSRQKRIENDLAAAMPQPTENTGATVAAAAEAAKEEERRKPLRARVAQWAQDIGADIEIHEDTSSITSSTVLNQINSGQGRVRGWYDNATGKVHVYMPGITDEHDIDETVIHEIVAHKGLRQLMGPRFDALCDKVYEMMSEDARQKYLAYPGVNGDTRAAADEYMAYLAENMENLTAEEQNVWQAIVAAVREFIKSVMTGSQMTDAQIEQLIRASYLNMKAQREQTTEAAAEPQLTDNTRAAVAAEREQTVEAAAQVAEKENLESQENAEKNVSLQTKEGRMGVVARQKNSAARLAKAKEIYGSDPTTSSFFDDMDVPQTAEELVAMTLVPRSINWEGIDRGTQHIRGLQEEMGRNKKRGIGRNFDTNGFNLYLAKKGEGVGIEKLVEDIWRSDKNGMGEGNMLGDQRRFDEHEIKDALLSLLSGAQTSKDISDYVLNNRIAQAEAAIEYMEEEAVYEQELYEQERREDARLAGILELTEDDWLQMEAEYADKIAEIEAKEREQREIFQQILEQDHQQAEYYGRANQEEVASERGIRMAEESAERGTAGSAERGETVLRGAQDTRDEGLSVGDAQLSEGALGAQNGRDGRSEDVHTQEAERSDVGETEALPQFTEELERQKAETNTNPTEAQKEAGNYKKGHLTFGGYKFTIEIPKGSVRSGKNKKGKAWKVTMPVTYGYILGKKGKDGDHLDMFINDKADLSTWNGSVFVVDQVNPETGEFDEHKIMYGFNDITDAIRAYLMSYTRPWRGMGNITEVSKEKFDEWVASSDRKLKPFAETRFGDKADVGTKVIRAAEERAGKRQEGETPEQDRDKQIEKAYKRGYNSYRREQYTDETLLEMYASMSNEAIEADISKMEQSIEEEKAYKDSEEYQERRSNESSDYTRAQTEGVAARAGKSVKALETNIAEAKRVLELRSMEERSAEEEEQVSFSIVTDPKKIAELEASPKRTGYRNVKLNEDGTFSSPMGYWLQSPKGGAKTRTKTDNFELGKWEEAQENPDLVDESNHIVLVKPDKGTVPVAYDPYIHNRLDPVNLQFKDAWKRDDLVYVETEVAETDLNSGYHADKALYPVGVHSWSNGDLMLSKYDKPVRVLPWEEVADAWAERLNGEGVNFDRVPKALRPLLIERGVEILPPTKGMGKDCKAAYEEWKDKGATELTKKKPTGSLSLLDVVRTLYSEGKEVASKLFSMKFFDVAQTPKFMQELGLRGDKFTIKYGVIARHLGKDGSHDLSERDWEQLPQALQNPFAISKLIGKDKSYRIYTTLQTGSGEYIVVGADVKNAGREIEVNAVSTVFGRRNNAHLPMNEEVIYRSNEITPEQSSLLERPNFAQYTTEQELSESKGTQKNQNEQEKGEKISFSVKPLAGNRNLTKGLRELEEGETCQVERIFTENKNFEFSSVNKVESYDDIAYIFKQLEDEAVENSFAVLVKRGKPTVIHLGMGHYTGTIVNQGVLTVAVNRVKPDKIYFVHNHPSGQLKASIEDIRVWQNLWEQYGSKLANGIIINTRSGKYGIFNNERSFDIATPSTSDADSKPLKVYSFNKQVFSKDYKPEGQIFNSEDVAKFVSSHRLGDRQKLGLILTNNKEITGNIFLPYSEITTYNARAIVNDIIYYTSVMGGTRAFMFGNVPLKDLRQKGISDLVAVFSNLRLVDYIEIDGGRYKSAADEDVSFSVVDDGTAAMPQYTEEEQGIVDEAKKSGTWMKAPNGKATNLTEKQWAQVRTKAFKKWFGDWEKIAEYKPIRYAYSVSDAIKSIEHLFNKPLANKKFGFTAIISKTKSDKLKSGKATKQSVSPRLHALAVANIDSLFENADIDIVHPDTKGNPDILNVHRLGTLIFDAKTNSFIPVKITAFEYNTNTGNRIYSIEAIDIEEIKKSAGQLEDDSKENPRSPIADFDAKINNLLESANTIYKNSSKIVDENGEPMVVYHGTMHHNFTVFKNNGSGIYFTPDKDTADYGLDADPYAVFINMREPLNLDFEGDVDNEATENHDSLENEYKNAIAEGYDGVVAENTFDGENEMTQIVVHRSNQIKSATDNVGTFDEGNDDIRFSVEDIQEEYDIPSELFDYYKKSIELGNLTAATQALNGIKDVVRQNIGKKLSEFIRVYKGIRDVIFDELGDIEKLREERERAALEQYDLMDAARKRAEEEAAIEAEKSRQLEMIVDLDSEYDKALQENDMERAQDLVSEAARRKGYIVTDYKDAHSAPVAQIERKEFTNLDALRDLSDNGFDLNVFALANGISNQPLEIFDRGMERAYMNVDAAGRESLAAIRSAISAIKDQLSEHGEVKDMPKIKVYRAAPKSIKGGLESGGQWVSPSLTYTQAHGEHRHGEGKYRIIEEEVPADELWWDGNDVREWGFDDGRNYVYKNTKNNKKLFDTITYDDAGKIIPLSKRFNSKKPDVRFRTNKSFEAGSRYEVKERVYNYYESEELDYYESEELVTGAYQTPHQLLEAVRNKHEEYAWKMNDDATEIECLGRWNELLPKKNGRNDGNDNNERIAKKTERAKAMIGDVAKMLGLDVEVLEDTDNLTDKKKTAKGWYDVTSGKITVVLPNHTSNADVMATLLHEGVAHHGLRKMFGKDFDAMLDNVYEESWAQGKINAIAGENASKERIREATEEYLARLAEDINFEKATEQKWWDNIRVAFVRMLRKAGITINVLLTDNELRYLLWRSYQNLKETAGKRTALETMEDHKKQKRLGVYDGNGRIEPAVAVAEDIRFRFVGEQGASNLDKAEEATTRLDNLNVAREMEEAGKDAKSIKMATGWERGADKKWRYEVEDKMEGIASPMDKLTALYREYKAAEKSFDRLMETSNRLPRLPRTATEEQKAKRKEFDKRLKEARETWLAKRETFMEADNRRNFTLEEILGADHELFAAYPQLKTSEVSFMDKSDYAGYSGVYMPESGNFWISPTADNPMSVLTHEIQHAIQHIEGFAQGGNTRSVQTKAETLKKDVQPLYEMIHDTPEWAEYKMLVNDYFDEYGKDQPDHDKIAEIESRLNEIEDSGVLKEIESKRKELKRKYGADATVTKILNGPFSSFDEIWEQLPSGFYDKFDAYYRLGGEVEARNAAERMGMTAAERRASLAEETEDVAREDQVFIFDGLESAAMPQSTKLSASNKAVAMYDKANGTNVKGFFNYLRNNKQVKKGEPTNFHIGNAGSLLEQYGIKGKFMVGQFTFSKQHTQDEDHNLSVNDWVNVINNLNNPLAITSYKGMPNQYRIYTYAMINGKNICVGVNVSLADGEISLSRIISAYGRDINNLLGKEKTNLIYPNIEELKRRISQGSTGPNSPLNATSTASGDKGTEKDLTEQENDEKVSFSVRDWRKEIRDAAEANGTWLKAPNGNKSNLNRYDWVTARGEKFKKWFGDWENGNANNPDELDANGEPLKESIDKYKTIKPIFKEGFKKWFGDWENGEVKRPDLLDSNGMPSEEAISRYVRFESFLSDEFKQWFGDWENGETNFPGLTDSDGNPKGIALTHYYKHKTIHSKSFKEWLGDWENGSARFAMVLGVDGLPYDWVVTAYRTRPKYPTKPEKELGESQAVYFSRYRLWERAKDGYQSVANKYLDDVLNGRLEQAQSEESFIEKAQAKYEIDLAKWKEEQGIPDDATPEEEQPMPLPGERSLDYANRLTQWQRRQAAWKLAPKLENYIQAGKDDYLVYLAKYEVSKYPHSRASNIKLESAQLAKLRHAVARQKSYDKNTVQAVVDFAQQFLMQGFGDNISRGDIRNLLSAVRNATGVKDIKQNIDKIIDILVDNHIRNIENTIQKMASIKAHKMNAQNVSVQGKLELRGQRLIKAYNEARATNMTIEELENMLSSLTEKMVDADPDTAAMYSAEYDGYSLALRYAKDITESLKEYTLMRKELRDAESNRELTYREKAQLVEQLRASMLDNRVERIHRYSNFIDEFSRYLDESIEGAKDFNEAQKRHQAEIYNMAMSDLAGVSSGTDLAIDRKSESLITRLSNNPLTQFFSSPLATFEQILKLFGQKYADGRGRLYNYFMQKWAEATRNEWSGKQKQFEILDDKAREIFGGKVKRWADLYSIVGKMPGIEVSYLDVDGVRKTTKLTQGNLLYIYMANKMADGAIKLRKQGISESDMEVIEKKLDPRLKSLADWVQSDFFVESRKKYNKIHMRLFGAPMAEIENYVPIRILSDARYQEQDVARLNKDTLPSTVTGAIVNRRMNSLPLDIAGTDALSLVIEHVEEMEHWAAFAEFSKDISTLLSYTPFRNKVKNMQTVYGSGDALWDRVMEVSNLAAGTYRPVVKRNTIDNAIANISKGLTLAKVAFRINTALKQLVSAIGFLHDIDIYNLFQNPFKAWKWAIKSMPQFQERWLGRKAGDTRLEDSDLDWKQWRQKFIKMSAYYGMTPNAFVDAVVSSCGAYAVYKTKYKRYKKTGYDNEQAHQKALLDAEQSFNLTQQSSKGAYIATIQADRTVAASALSVFRNSSFSFTRQSVEAFRNLRRKIGRGYKEEAIIHMKRQMMLDGIPEDKAEAAAKAEYSRSIRRDLIRIVVFSYMNTIAWQLAGYWSYLLFGDDDEEKEKALTDALIRGMLAGPIEGLAGGNILSDLIGISVSSEGLTTEGLKNYRFYGLPAFSDVQKMIETFEHDQIAGLQDVINLLVQAGFGTNPEVLTNSAIALIDYCNGDLDSAFEFGLLLLRLNQSSSKELDNYYIDALGMSSDEIKKADFDELAKRWATYKMRQNAPMTSWMYSDERKSKKMESYMKAFDKKVQERMEGLTEEQFEKNYNRSESNAERLVAIKIGGDREGLKHASKMKNAHLASYLKKSTWDDIREDMEIEKKKRELAPVNKSLEELKDSGASPEALSLFIQENTKELNLYKTIVNTLKDIRSDQEEMQNPGKQGPDELLNGIRQKRKELFEKFK